MDKTLLLQEAKRFLELAYDLHMKGRLNDAIELYQRSIELWPTPEAHTYLGWSYSLQGRLDDAIEQCRHAIDLDPEFGNPYNDIGAYLMQMDRFEEATHWLELACDAPRYDARHYPFFNLGRVRERFGDFRGAIQAYDESASLDPTYEPPRIAAERLRAWMN